MDCDRDIDGLHVIGSIILVAEQKPQHTPTARILHESNLRVPDDDDDETVR